jgi:hypothetical protein
MQAGAFALIDALGFKGIWKRLGEASEERILAKLEKMEKTTREDVDFANGMPQPVGSPDLVGDVHVTFLSDTIAMGCELGKEPADSAGRLTERSRAIVTLVLHLSKLLKIAALSDPPLAYRGCISAGSFSLKGNFSRLSARHAASGHPEQPSDARCSGRRRWHRAAIVVPCCSWIIGSNL